MEGEEEEMVIMESPKEQEPHIEIKEIKQSLSPSLSDNISETEIEEKGLHVIQSVENTNATNNHVILNSGMF